MTASTRRVRPWLAALLTFLGWGVGLYYARRTRTAIHLAMAQVLIPVLLGGGLTAYLALHGPVSIPIAKSIGFSAVDAVSLLLSAFVAVGVWVVVVKHGPFVDRAGRARLWGYLAIWLLPIIGAVFLALLMRFFLVQPFNIPSGAMRPTLQVGDFIAVKKWSYGYSRFSIVPFENALPAGRIFDNPPERGDVLVFKNQNDRNLDYVKRVIGLPGDQIQMIGGVVHINGQSVKKEFASLIETKCDGMNAEIPTFRETLPNGVSYVVEECHGDLGNLDNVGPYLVPDGHYFMLGDNRDQSQDSRVTATVGFIPYDNLIGKVAIGSQRRTQ